MLTLAVCISMHTAAVQPYKCYPRICTSNCLWQRTGTDVLTVYTAFGSDWRCCLFCRMCALHSTRVCVCVHQVCLVFLQDSLRSNAFHPFIKWMRIRLEVIYFTHSLCSCSSTLTRSIHTRAISISCVCVSCISSQAHRHGLQFAWSSEMQPCQAKTLCSQDRESHTQTRTRTRTRTLAC